MLLESDRSPAAIWMNAEVRQVLALLLGGTVGTAVLWAGLDVLDLPFLLTLLAAIGAVSGVVMIDQRVGRSGWYGAGVRSDLDQARVALGPWGVLLVRLAGAAGLMALLSLVVRIIPDGLSYSFGLKLPLIIMLLMAPWVWAEARRAHTAPPTPGEWAFALACGGAVSGVAIGLLWLIIVVIAGGDNSLDLRGWLALSPVLAIGLGVVALAGAATVRSMQGVLGSDPRDRRRALPLGGGALVHVALGAASGVAFFHLLGGAVLLSDLLLGLEREVGAARLFAGAASHMGLAPDPLLGYALIICGPSALAGALLALWATRGRG